MGTSLVEPRARCKGQVDTLYSTQPVAPCTHHQPNLMLIWNPLYHVYLVPSEGVFLLSEAETRLLDDARVMALAPLLAEGQHTAVSLAEQTPLPPAETHYILHWLREKKYVVEVTPPQPTKTSGNRPPHPKKLHLTAVDDRLHLTPLIDTLTAAGFQPLPDDQPAPLRLVLTVDEQEPALAPLNQKQLATGQPWLLCRPVGQKTLWFGPFFTPDAPCWACLAERRRNLTPLRSYLHDQWPNSRLDLGAKGILPPHPAAASQLSHLLTAWFQQANPQDRVGGQLWLYDIEQKTTAVYPVTPRPQCPACGDPTLLAQRQNRPPSLDPPPTPPTPLTQQENPITGLVRTVQPTLSGALHAATTQHNVALPHTDWRSVRRLVRGRAGGKGRTAVQAYHSAVAETIERYAAVWQGDEAIAHGRVGAWANMHHPHDLLLFSPQQYAQRETWNPTAPPFNHIPEPFDPTQEIGWSPFWSLLTGEKHWIPTALVYYGYAQKVGTTFGRADSNGCAAGQSLPHAIVQAFCELVERDGVAIWWYNQIPRPGVAWERFGAGAEMAEAMSQLYDVEGREVWFLDMTTDFGLPTFTAVSRFRPDDPRTAQGEGLLFGFGTHLDPQIALWRALTELGQMVPLLRAGIPTAVQFDHTAVAWWHTATLAQHPYLRPDPTQTARTPAHYPTQHQPDMRDNAHHCLQRAHSLGLDVLLHDQTRPDTRLPVVKLIIPTLRHFWARFAPGRLYDVPVQLDWLPAPLAESALNSHPIFL